MSARIRFFLVYRWAGRMLLDASRLRRHDPPAGLLARRGPVRVA